MLGRKTDTGGEGVQLGMVITPMLDMAFQLLAFFVMVYNPQPQESRVDAGLLPAVKEKEKEKETPPPPKVGNKEKKGDEDPPEKKDEEPKIDKKPEDKPPEEKELNKDLRVIVKAVSKADGRPDPKDPKFKFEDKDIGFYDGQPKEIYLHKPGVAEREKNPVWFAGQTDKKEEKEELIVFGKGGMDRLRSQLKEIRDGLQGDEVTVNIDADPNLKYEYFIRIYDLCRSVKPKFKVMFHAPQKVP
jgi:biopolymer transport protein ExbD